MHAEDNWAMTRLRISICCSSNGSIFMFVSTFMRIIWDDLKRPKHDKPAALHCCQILRPKKWLVRNSPVLTSHAWIPNLHSLSRCQVMFPCLHLSPNICTMRCSKAANICVYRFILTVHFILENWLLFWYNCGLHERKSSAEKLIFLCKCCKCTYCSCVMLYD